jgi:ATP-dependent helicase/nuclease subunit A
MPESNPLLPALDPSRCTVVEACAGSGKTWLLVSRMLRLLLAGAAPSELLAITFTRKAAAEIEARLDAWLTELALLPDDQALDFLEQRGLDAAAARAALPAARDLLERTLAAPPMITTFHGWFFHLIARAPLPLRLPGEVLEDAALLREEAWYALAESLGRAPGSAAECAFRELAEELPLTSLKGLLNALLARRAEWWAAGENHDDPVAAACLALEDRLGVREADDPEAELRAEDEFADHLTAYLRLLQRNGVSLKTDAQRAALLAAALEQPGIEALIPVFLTKEGEARACKFSDALVKRLGGDAQPYVDLHFHLAERLLTCRDRQAEQRALRLNRLGLTLGQAYLDTYQKLKSERGGLDFSDGELEAARLLDDDAAAGAILSRLDARWKHLLLDEFQDANPLQWRVLQDWLAAYGQDGERPTVFLVGDPKQSIYRFRRAEPRLFAVAGAWLETNFQARHFPQNQTRRCAPRVVAWVNAVFSERDDYPVFSRHSALQTQLTGHCELFIGEAKAAPADAIAFRDPLTQSPPAQPHKRAEEAAWVARRIVEIVGHLELADGQRARYGDITVLYAKRGDLDQFESAFKQAGIPYVGDRRGGLLGSLEVEDLTALLAALISPLDDLALAHALKSPVFGCSDDHLKHLAARLEEDAPWWQRLRTWAEEADVPAPIARAARLLESWRDACGHLPVHDLLDRIYHEGDVLARYAAAVPASLAPGVRANLQGLLGLSLGLSGGRYPSLPRFLDELKQLRDKAGQDAPDEPPASDGDAVRMLTIHAAKGLEAPVVFLIKADDNEGRVEHSGVIMDWQPDRPRPDHFSLYGAKAWRGHGRDDLFAREQEQAARERLNLLYVAMTRARQALFVSGIQGANQELANWLGLLAPALSEAHAEISGSPAMTWCDAPLPASPDGAGTRTAQSTESGDALVPAIGLYRPPSPAEADFGIGVHACLEWLTQGIPESETLARLGLDPELTQATHAAVQRILAIPELALAFDPIRHLRAHNEMEFQDAEGRIFRIDRLIEFADEIWVLDYKTGGLTEPDPALRAQAHAEQLDGYLTAMRQLFPTKPVRAVLAFADGRVHWLD